MQYLKENKMEITKEEAQALYKLLYNSNLVTLEYKGEIEPQYNWDDDILFTHEDGKIIQQMFYSKFIPARERGEI